MMFRDEMKRAAEDFGLALSETQLAQFTRYYELLVEWNEKMNLTAITEEHEVAVKHMVDSLSAYDPALFDGAVSIIDVGTGAGFPGLPLKIFCPDVRLISAQFAELFPRRPLIRLRQRGNIVVYCAVSGIPDNGIEAAANVRCPHQVQKIRALDLHKEAIDVQDVAFLLGAFHAFERS